MQCGSVISVKSRRGEQQVLMMVAMRTLVVLLVAVLITVESVDNNENGQYVADDEGRYYPDNSGQYIPDFSGRYTHDPTGNYKNDGTGRYTGDANGFLTGRSRNLLDTALTRKPAPIPTPAPIRTSPVSSTTTQRAAPEGHWKIIRQVIDTGLDGYHWEYETENNIVAEETGRLENKGTDAEAIRAKGFFKYTGPDNVDYSIVYKADENGFVAEGKHIPTEPPLPDAIIKAIEDYRRIAADLEAKSKV